MKRNVVLYVCDDLRFDALGCMGNPIVQTPNLDRLSAEGTTFTRCYMPGGTSGAVCMPSRAMLHTGRSLFQIQDEGQDIADEHLLLGEHLQQQGYDTFHAGKWHNGRRSFARAFEDGDEIFFGGMGDQWNVPVYRFDPSGAYDSKLPFVGDASYESRLRHRDGDHIHVGVHSTTLFTDAACAYLDRQDGEKPFFLSVALTAPHDPRNAPQAFHDMYPVEDIPLPENFLAMHPHDTGFHARHLVDDEYIRARDEDLAWMPRNPAEIRQHLADYYAMTSHLDHEFGRLYATLEAKGLLEDTIIVFTADHGLAVGQHGLMGKQSTYDHSVRVPLILRGPGVPTGERPGQLVCHYDLYRSLCELTGLSVPSSVQSESLIDVWQGGEGRDELYLAYGSTLRALLQDHWKLMEYAGPNDYRATQLFDLASDPLERHDLAPAPGQETRIADLRRRLTEMSEESGDRTHRKGVEFWKTHLDGHVL